jgi:DNA polymerase elongation subunit (family B)
MFWRPGWRVNIPHDNIIQESAIICACYKWEGSKKVEHLEWNKGDDRELCEQFIEIANQADELVAHNGDKFDLPWLKARCLFHELDPTPIYKTVDTLVIARRRFKFNSNRLDYLG